MSRAPDIAGLVGRAIEQMACAAGCTLSIEATESVRWASATFNGDRLGLVATAAPSPALDQLLADLPEADFALRGHLVADLVITAVARAAGTVRIELEILTLEDR